MSVSITTVKIKSLALWRAFYFTLFVGTFLPTIAMLYAFHIGGSYGLTSILQTMRINIPEVIVFAPIVYLPLYFVAYIYLHFHHRCPFCKHTWAFALQPRDKSSSNTAKCAYQCIACGHRDF